MTAWVAGLTLFGLVIVLSGEDIAEAIASASLPPLIAALAFATTLYPIAAWRWAYVTNQLEQREVATYLQFLQVRSLVAAGGFFAPRELVELGGRTIWLARAKGLSAGHATKSVLVDRFCDVLIGSVALSGALSFWLLELSALLSFAIGLVCLLAAIGVIPPLMCAASGFIRRLNSRMNLPDRQPTRIGSSVAMLTKLIDVPPGIWRVALLASLLKFMVVVLRVVLLGSAVHLACEPLQLAVSVPLGQVGYALGITPGGLGVYEAGWYGLLHLLGSSAAQIGAFVILLRLSLITSVLFVLPFAFSWRCARPPAAPMR